MYGSSRRAVAGRFEGHHKHAQDSLHSGVFHAVDNAKGIRDLITERLRQFRESGLGDPDETREALVRALHGYPDRMRTRWRRPRNCWMEARALRGVLG